jgi:hypothetical protein
MGGSSLRLPARAAGLRRSAPSARASRQGIRRPQPAERKRIRKHVEAPATGQQQRSTADKLRSQLFGDDEEGAPPPPRRPRPT